MWEPDDSKDERRDGVNACGNYGSGHGNADILHDEKLRAELYNK